MNILVTRFAFRHAYTIGKLYVDGQYFCDTIEDADRGLTQNMDTDKIHVIKDRNKDGNHTNDCITAIPYGEYKITLAVRSPKYSKIAAYDFCNGHVPRLMNVPGFDGVLIHIGNTASHSAGCILVGENKVVGQVLNSTATFKKLYQKLKQAWDQGEEIWIKIAK